MLPWYYSAAVCSAVAFSFVHFVVQQSPLLARLLFASRGFGCVRSNRSSGLLSDKVVITIVERDTQRVSRLRALHS